VRWLIPIGGYSYDQKRIRAEVWKELIDRISKKVIWKAVRTIRPDGKDDIPKRISLKQSEQ